MWKARKQPLKSHIRMSSSSVDELEWQTQQMMSEWEMPEDVVEATSEVSELQSSTRSSIIESNRGCEVGEIVSVRQCDL